MENTEKQGMLRLKLLPGEWYAHVEKAAPGYCETLAREPITVKDEVGERLSNIKVSKAKTLTGNIRGIDLELHRARWIRVEWTDKDQGKGFSYGIVHADATFSVSIPNYATEGEFSIAGRRDHNGQLSIESRDPLVLTGD